MHRLHCTRCGASWPSESEFAHCPVCALQHGVSPNAHGSPSPGEDLLASEVLAADPDDAP